MKKNTLKILLATTLIAVGAGAAIAQERGGPRMSFEQLDVDGSGEITVEDLTAMRDSRFAGVDANGDGNVTLDEFKAAEMARAGERAAEMFARLDVDGDGILSRDVLERGRGDERGARMIERFDTDNSGGVSAEEFEQARLMMREHGERGEGRERGFGKRHN